MDLGKRLKARRQSLDLTLSQAAKLAGFNNFQTLYKICLLYTSDAADE